MPKTGISLSKKHHHLTNYLYIRLHKTILSLSLTSKPNKSKRYVGSSCFSPVPLLSHSRHLKEPLTAEEKASRRAWAAATGRCTVIALFIIGLCVVQLYCIYVCVLVGPPTWSSEILLGLRRVRVSA